MLLTLILDVSDIVASKEGGGQSNSQTQKDPIHKAIGVSF